jgi:RNA polymerase sigma factor (sigma-70 family)
MNAVAFPEQESVTGIKPQQTVSEIQGHFAAEQKSLLGHLRMVSDIARNYENCGAQTAELIRAGNLGLIHALEYYEPGNAEQFAGYAARCIRQHIERFLTARQRHHEAAEPAAHYAATPHRPRKPAGKESGNQGIYVVRAYIESRIGELRRSVHAGHRPGCGGLCD